MIRRIETSCIINAPIEDVWSLVSDFSTYKDWSGVIRFPWGAVQTGRRGMMLLKLWRFVPVPVPIRVISVVPKLLLEWTGGLPGLVLGRHYFRLSSTPGSPEEEDRTIVIHGEEFSGLFAPLALKAGLGRFSLSAYETMNAGLKFRAESIVSVSLK